MTQKYILIGAAVAGLSFFFGPPAIQTLNGLTSPLLGSLVLGGAVGVGYMYMEQGGMQTGQKK